MSLGIDVPDESQWADEYDHESGGARVLELWRRGPEATPYKQCHCHDEDHPGAEKPWTLIPVADSALFIEDIRAAAEQMMPTLKGLVSLLRQEPDSDVRLTDAIVLLMLAATAGGR